MSNSGRRRRLLKSVLKVRTIDLRMGKKGMTATFLEEAKKISAREKMIKIAFSADKKTRLNQSQALAKALDLELISVVGKTASFAHWEDVE